MKIVIIGGVAAGMSAASKAKRVNPDSEIIVFEKGNETSYGACGLPYYISNVNEDVNLLRIRTPEEFRKQNIDVRILHEVKDVNLEENKITVYDILNEQEFEETYDKLVITSGASPVIPPIIGLEKKYNNVFSVKTIEDADRIKRYLANENIKNVCIIGAGYIGLEMVEACAKIGKKVTIVEMRDVLLSSVDHEMSDTIHKELEKHSVTVRLSETIHEVIGEEQVYKVKSNKNEYDVDAVIVAVGVKPNTHFLKNTNIELAANGAIITNKKMETNCRDVYAGGDCSLIHHKILNKNVYLPLGTNANKQGKIIGENILGKNKKFPGAMGTAAIKVFDLEVGRTGISEKEAQENNIRYDTVLVQAPSHAPYYPNQKIIHIKLIYDPNTKIILGAQLVGEKGAAIRTDVFAAIIDARYTAEQVSDLDFCYAPPFAYVWDAVQIAANMILSK